MSSSRRLNPTNDLPTTGPLGRLLRFPGFLLLAWMLVGSADASAKPVQVFILAGQSNMEGQSVADLDGPDYNGGRGTLVERMKDPVVGPGLRHLRRADGKWTVRDDVWVRYQRVDQPLLAGPLTVGFSVYGGGHHFGPELAFGHVLGDALEDPVLLIKTAWGGKSLHRDFRPPSAGGTVGPEYLRMIGEVKLALEKLGEEFPALAGKGHRLAGFVWYQGWNDGVDPRNAVPEYGTNLVRLIRDLRRDLGAPALPVVVGELTGPWVDAPPEWTALRQAQADAASLPEFAGTVRFVGTRQFVRAPEVSPNPGHGHHEFGNAETGYRVGEALGNGMLELLRPAGTAPVASVDLPLDPDRGIRFNPVVRDIEGWSVHLDPALLAGARQAEGTLAITMLANHLQRIRILVPAEPLARLRTIGIWMELDHPRLHSMQYHPSRDWLVANRHDPRLTRKVHVTQAGELLSREQMLKHPAVLLHELAHGYHDQVLSFDNPEIAAAHAAAAKSGGYDRVLAHTGAEVRHYGLNNPMEYFAEGTEAYLYRNDFFPFVAAELKRHDPTLFGVLERIWGSLR